MKKETKQELQNNVVTGMSSAAGSAAGVVIGSMVSEEVHAEVIATPTNELANEVVAEPIKPTGANQQVAETVVTVPEDDVEVIVSQPENLQEIEVTNPHIVEEAKPNVLSYETVTADNGQQMDVALVDMDGTPVAIVDMDRDGTADVALADLNGNDELDADEVLDLTDMNVDMQQFNPSANGVEQATAQTADIDYVNDANVDTYFA